VTAEGKEGSNSPFPKFWAAGKLAVNVVVQNFLSKNANNTIKKFPFGGKFRGKIKILSTHKITCSVKNLQLTVANCNFMRRLLI